MIYLDHHAASPLDARVARAMTDAPFGNPESAHGVGRRARKAVEEARAAVARSVGVTPNEVVFTSGGTEACNLGVLGLPGARVWTSALEHPAVRAAVDARGGQVGFLDVAPGHAPTVDEVAGRVREGDLVVVQHASHETGAVADVDAMADVVHAAGARLFVDAVASYGRLGVALRADAWALASHKVGGPPGAGALIVRRGLPLEPQVRGGGQERGRRGGTPDVRALVGFGVAASLVEERRAGMPAVAARRDALERALLELGGEVSARGNRTASVTHVAFPRWRGAELVAALDLEGLACSAGAACSSGVTTGSPAMLAWYPHESWRVQGTLRLSLGPETTDDEVTAAIEILRRVIPRA
ncbi:MAG: aminotransferase class V-fold PLP-dependent enzyme [Polyangiales bacterium]